MYNIIAEDELSASKALTNYYLLRNSDVRLARIDNLPLKLRHGNSVELLYRTDHISTLARKSGNENSGEDGRGTLQRTPLTIQTATELSYGMECKTSSCKIHYRSPALRTACFFYIHKDTNYMPDIRYRCFAHAVRTSRFNISFDVRLLLFTFQQQWRSFLEGSEL